ncbi:MAG: type I glutamate--ammonia ligase [Eubacterium sp.]|nr:type I glutamate--ammonia ligase [Eubacterium sp.]MDE6413317.1 type I glutamate--ammonia ligase [Eubacterium sp.]
MSKLTKEDILKDAVEKNVEFVRLQFTDVFGLMKNVSITVSQLEKALDNECMFDGSSIDGYVRIDESDMYLRPDLDSWALFPWRTFGGKTTARLICSVYKADQTPFMGDPRNVLKKVIDEAAEMGYGFNVGPELEFFLFKKDENGNPTTEMTDLGGYFDLNPIDAGENCRRDICLALEDMGYEIEASHHEVAESQHEIDFRFGEVMTTADRCMTFKHVVKTYATKHGLHATFMPKPVYGINGSGMHTNMSLYRLADGSNAFADENDEIGLSKEAYAFIAGVMAHVKGIAAFSNPLVNSYKRLVPGYEAPCYIAWSASNRSSLVRIPAARGKGTRVELRNPDPTCNPYLEMALCLAAGLDGIKKNMTPPDAVDFNVFDLTPAELKEHGIDCLPGSLIEAVYAAEEDPFVRETVGDHVFNAYIEGKKREWDEYRTQISQWEVNRYLKK